MSLTAQWLSAFGTVGGAVATTVAVMVALFGLRRELQRANEQRDLDRADRARDRAERLDREAAQARLVLVTVEHLPATRGQRSPRLASPSPQCEVQVHLDNQSELPVLAADLEHVLVRVPSGQHPEEVLEPPQHWEALGEEEHPRHLRSPLGAGRQATWVVSIFEPTGPSASRQRTVLATDSYEAAVVFTDAAGLRWARDTNPTPPRRHLTAAPDSDDAVRPTGDAPLGDDLDDPPW